MQQEIQGIQDATRREAVGVFDDIKSLNEAVAELESTAFPRHDISVIDAATMRQDGQIQTAEASEDDPAVPRTILIRPEEETIGMGVLVGGGCYAGVVTGLLIAGFVQPLYYILTVAALGGIFGAALGGLVAFLLSKYYHGVLNEQISKGGMVLWVRTGEIDKEKIAFKIMRKHGARDVHIHEIH